jgi:hypothetical protein
MNRPEYCAHRTAAGTCRLDRRAGTVALAAPPCESRRAAQCSRYEFDCPQARAWSETLDNAGRSVRPMRRFA